MSFIYAFPIGETNTRSLVDRIYCKKDIMDFLLPVGFEFRGSLWFLGQNRENSTGLPCTVGHPSGKHWRERERRDTHEQSVETTKQPSVVRMRLLTCRVSQEVWSNSFGTSSHYTLVFLCLAVSQSLLQQRAYSDSLS